MFKNLFKPKWKNANPEVRITAIANLDSDNVEHQSIIETLAHEDPVPAVRAAAILRLRNMVTLMRLMQGERDADTRQKIQSHVVTLLEDPAVSAALPETLASMTADTLVALLGQAKHPALGERMLAAVQQESMLASLAIRLPLASLRQAAAHRVEQQALLEEMSKAARGKDKSVYRIAREKLDHIHAEQQAEANTGQRIAALCAAMEAHARLSLDPQYVAKFDYLQKQWQRIQVHASADQQRRYDQAESLCRAHIEENAAEVDKLQEEARRQREAAAEREAACDQLELTFQQLASMGMQPHDRAAALAALKTQKNRWEEAASLAEPPVDERKRFQRACTQLDNLLDAAQTLHKNAAAIERAAQALLETRATSLHELTTLKKALDEACQGVPWPAGAALPEVLALRDRAIVYFGEVHPVLQKSEQDAQEQVETGIRQLLKEIERGNLKAANNALRECQQLLKMLPMGKAQVFQRQLRELTVKVNELRDWQGFATQPKKEALCESMEALIGSDLDPQALAGKIRRLQEEWRMLGTADADRSQSLWERFSRAADQAYEPCRRYFDALSQLRETNLAARQAICQQLDDYLHKTDWTRIDWRAAREIFELAKQEWRNHSPVERKAGKDVQARFNGLLEELQQRLMQEFEKNAQARRALIAQAESLLEASDLPGALEKAKQLQRQWRDTGMVNPRDDGKLWKQFRAACDSLFSRRDQHRVDAQAERERHLAEAEALCDQIENLANTVMFDAVAANEQFHQLQAQFEQLGGLPKEHADAVRKRYRALTEHFRSHLGQAQLRLRARRFEALWQLAEWLEEQEAQLLAGDSLSAASLPDTDPLPEGAGQVAQQRWQSLQQCDMHLPHEQQLVANTSRLHELCVRLEIAAGLESPSEDKDYRMQLQITRFNKGEAQREAHWSLPDIAEKLQLEWLGVGMALPAERQVYKRRFRDALQKISA